MKLRYYLILAVLAPFAVVFGLSMMNSAKHTGNGAALGETVAGTPSQPKSTAKPKPAVTPVAGSGTLPVAKTLVTNYHTFQTFNNCAPAALSIALSFFDITASQEKLAADLRPYNNRAGLNDDKSTPPDELVAESEKYGLIGYFRPGGDIETIRKIIASGRPVLIRTLLDTSHDFAHYRVVKGYDDNTQELIQDDSYTGKNIRFRYDDFLKLWKPYNYGYVVLARPSEKAVIENIIGADIDEGVAWQHALERAGNELAQNPADVEAQFNRAVALYYLGKNQESVQAFEKVENRLGKHVLWYQMQPIDAYFALGNYDRVFALTDKIFNDGDKAYTELYILRGKSYQKLGKNDLARAEFEKAVMYNVNSKAAREVLAASGGTN